MAVTENEVKKACLDWLRYNGFLAIRVNNGARKASYTNRHGETKQRFFRFADVPGVSDIIFCSPGGRFGVIETKRPGKKHNTSPEQELFLADVRERGGIALVVESVDEMIAALLAIPKELL